MRGRYIAAVLLIVLTAGCVKLTPDKVDCDRLVDIEQRNECLYNQSVNNLDTSTCGNIMGMEMRVNCVDDIAVKLLDYYPCRQLDKAIQRDACEAKVSDARRIAREHKQTTPAT